MGSPEGTFDTSLHEAVRNGVVEEVQVALRQGYDPNLIGLFQWNPMHEAADNGDEEILKLLIQKKGDPNKKDYIQGRTPMHYATEKGNIRCLKLLIDCGGRYDIKDEMGKDCLDLCTPSSRKILERLKVRDLLLKPDDKSGTSDKTEIILNETSVDQNSVDSESTSRRSSVSVSSLQEKEPVIGYLHMSVEYHSVNQSLKIRIWQLTDILLPPPHTSGIHSIYVKSYLLPDKKKDTKRKTEDIRVDTSEAHVQWKNKSSHQHVFMPSTFKFKRPLEYQKINKELVNERSVQIEVCITQRYTHRSFLIGMLHLPLKKAVKKVVREKMALIPCMNHTIPSNMKVYCASDLDITSNKVFYSTPNVKVEIPESVDVSSEKASSIPNLKVNEYSPTVEVDISKMVRAHPNVPRLNLEDTTLDESGYSSELHISMPGELDSPDSDKGIVKQHNVINLTKIGETSTDGEAQGMVNKVLEGVKDKLTRKTRAVTKMADGIEVTDLDEEEPVSISIETDTEGKNDVSIAIKSDGQSSRPETPTWDYYDVPTEIEIVKDEEPLTQWKEGAAPVVLPMETNLSLHQSKESNSASNVNSVKPKEKVKKRSKKRNVPPVPGRAMPLVPEIVVVNADECSIKTKSINLPDTKVNIVDNDKQWLHECVYPSDTGEGVDVEHVIEMKDVGTVSEKSKSSTKREPAFKGNNSGEARAICIIEPTGCSESIVNIEDSKHSLPVARPRLKKLSRKVKEGGTRNTPDSQQSKYGQTLSEDNLQGEGKKSRLVFQKVKSRQTDSEGSRVKSGLVSEKIKSKQTGPGIASRISENSSTSELRGITVTSNERPSTRKGTNSASVFVDMDKLSFAHSGSHIVELDDEISITELSENSDLFSHSSVKSSTSVEIDEGLESYKLPEQVSPTKYMIPMQVFMEDDTSCDESLATDRSERSYSARKVRNTTSEI